MLHMGPKDIFCSTKISKKKYYLFYVELAPLLGILGPLKSDLGVFWPFQATDFIMGILKIWDNFLGPHGPILKFTFLESLRNL